MVVGPHPLSNPANWARFSCQWLLRKNAESTSLAGSLSEGDHPTFRRHQVQFQIRWGQLNDGLKPAWMLTSSFENHVSFPRLFHRFALGTPKTDRH
jgi:hypothetical protein